VPDEASTQPAARRTPSSSAGQNLYADAMTPEEQARLAALQESEGLADEIALLRLRIQDELRDDGANLRLIVQGIDALRRAVVAQYKLSPQADKEMEAKLHAVSRDILRQFSARDDYDE